MAVTRHQIRALYLDPVADRLLAAVDPQWLNLTLFLVLLVVGVTVLGAVIRKLLAIPATGEDAALSGLSAPLSAPSRGSLAPPGRAARPG